MDPRQTVTEHLLSQFDAWINQGKSSYVSDKVIAEHKELIDKLYREALIKLRLEEMIWTRDKQ